MGTKRLRILTTGGTIDKVYFDAKSSYEIGEPMVGQMLKEAEAAFEFEITEVLRKDSLDLTDADRALIRRAVDEAEDERIVITHGTDTMPETAAALAGVQGKTVVLTGALHPARFRWSDAIFNVGGAVAAAWVLPHGVWIVMNGRVYRGDAVRKNRELNRFEDA
jgi:L-asparaginase